jgi:ankyrin repeat protein
MTTEALEPELARPTPPDEPVRFEYRTRTLLVVRVIAGVLVLPFVAMLVTRGTGVPALAALVLAVSGGWLLVQAQRRVTTRARSVVITPDGLSLIGGRAGELRWADITVMQHSAVRGVVRFGTRTQPHAVMVDADLDGYTRFIALAASRIDASRRGDEPAQQRARTALFHRAVHEDIALLGGLLLGIILGLVVRPAYFIVTALALPRLLWHWLRTPHSVAVDDTAVWVIRPLARNAIPLRAIRDIGFGIAGRTLRPAVIIDHRDGGRTVIDGFGAAALPLLDTIAATRVRAHAQARTGPATTRTGSAVRRAGSRDRSLTRAGAVALALLVIGWITVLTGAPLRTATRFGNTIIVRSALLLGAPLESADGRGFTALHHAAERNHIAITRALIDRGADANARSTPDGLTPVHIAAERGHREIMALLAAGGADVNARSAAGLTPLAQSAVAGAAGDTAVATLLLRAGADPDIADEDGRTPLHHAALNGHAAFIRPVARAGAAIDAQDETGDRALHAAARAKQQAATAALIDAGADVDARGSAGRTAIANAADANAPVALVNLLLDAGARAGIADDNGWNAIQLAARANNVELLELFARRRAPLNATSGRVAPALWLATESGHTAAARALLRGGASPYVTWNGRRAIDVARANRNATLVALMQMR